MMFITYTIADSVGRHKSLRRTLEEMAPDRVGESHQHGRIFRERKDALNFARQWCKNSTFTVNNSQLSWEYIPFHISSMLVVRNLKIGEITETEHPRRWSWSYDMFTVYFQVTGEAHIRQDLGGVERWFQFESPRRPFCVIPLQFFNRDYHLDHAR